HHQVGRAFVDRDADVAHIDGKARLRNRHTILHLHLCDIEIGAELEGHRNRETPVAGRIRRQVDHVFDAIDLLLDGRDHGGGHDVGARAGILTRHGDGGRGDLGILRNRQTRECDASEDHEDDRDHGGKYRPVDEKMRNTHALTGSVYFAFSGGLPAAAGAAGLSPGFSPGLAPSSCGRTFWPGRACIKPLTTTRSSGPMPSLMTRRLSCVSWPSVTYLGRAMSWSSMTVTKRRA